MTKVGTILNEENVLEVYLYKFSHKELQEAKEKHIQKIRLLGMV